MNARERAATRLWSAALERNPAIAALATAAELPEDVVDAMIPGHLSPRSRIDYRFAIRRLHRRGDLPAEPAPATEPRRRRVRAEVREEVAAAPEDWTPAACPHCAQGVDALLVVRHVASGMRAVFCDGERGGCGASGGWRETEAEAIQAWGVDG